MFNTSIIIVVFALLVGIGGAIGYLKSSSIISLVAGISSAVALALSAIAVYRKKRWGLFAAIAIGIILLILFIIRFAKTKALMPSGLMAILSLIFAILMIVSGRLHKKAPRGR